MSTGGFYDHVVPPRAVPPDEFTTEYTFDQLGLRVPALLVSPWVKAGVEKAIFDHTSLLKYLIEKWNLTPLGKRVADATSIGIALQAEMRENAMPLAIRVSFSSLASEHPEWELTDLTRHHLAIMAFLADAASRMDGLGIEEEGLRAFGWIGSIRTWLGRVLIKLGRYLCVTPLNKRSGAVEAVTRRLIEPSGKEYSHTVKNEP